MATQRSGDEGFNADDLCLFRKPGELSGLIVRVSGPTGGSVGPARYYRPGDPNPPTPASHLHFHTEPPTPAGSWGQYLVKVSPDFAEQVAVFLEELAHDANLLNHPKKILGQTGKLKGVKRSAEVQIPTDLTQPWTVFVDGKQVATVTEPFSRRALEALASLLRNRLAA